MWSWPVDDDLSKLAFLRPRHCYHLLCAQNFTWKFFNQGVSMKHMVISTVLMGLCLTACSSHKDSKKSRKSEPSVAYVGPESFEQKEIKESELNSIVSNWSPQSQDLIKKMVSKYGSPNEISDNRVTWHNNGQWRRTEISRNFGKDALKQTASMPIPPERLGEVAMFNKDIIVNQAEGEVTATGNSERHNFLVLNLAKEVIDGRLSPYEARRQFSSMTGNQNRANYTEELNFSLPASGTRQSQEAEE
jgi:hypothetical protein